MKRKMSAALIQTCMECFIRGLPLRVFSSPLRSTMPRVSIILVYIGLSSFMMATQLVDKAPDELAECVLQHQIS